MVVDSGFILNMLLMLDAGNWILDARYCRIRMRSIYPPFSIPPGRGGKGVPGAWVF
jgi:hypothetical protein